MRPSVVVGLDPDAGLGVSELDAIQAAAGAPGAAVVHVPASVLLRVDLDVDERILDRYTVAGNAEVEGRDAIVGIDAALSVLDAQVDLLAGNVRVGWLVVKWAQARNPAFADSPHRNCPVHFHFRWRTPFLLFDPIKVSGKGVWRCRF